jgi:hypothetical protein
MDFDAGQKARQLGNPTGRSRQPFLGQEVRSAMQDHGMQARIAQYNLKPGAGCRIAGNDAVDVIQKMLEHNVACYDMLAARRNFLRKIANPNIGTRFYDMVIVRDIGKWIPRVKFGPAAAA